MFLNIPIIFKYERRLPVCLSLQKKKRQKRISSYSLQHFDKICLMFYRGNTTYSRKFVFRPTAHRTHRQHDGCIPNESKCSVVCEMRSQKRYDPRMTKFFVFLLIKLIISVYLNHIVLSSVKPKKTNIFYCFI